MDNLSHFELVQKQKQSDGASQMERFLKNNKIENPENLEPTNRVDLNRDEIEVYKNFINIVNENKSLPPAQRIKMAYEKSKMSPELFRKIRNNIKIDLKKSINIRKMITIDTGTEGVNSKAGSIDNWKPDNLSQKTQRKRKIKKALQNIASKNNVSPKDVKNQFKIGKDVEREHNLGKKQTTKTVIDHLKEKWDYYTAPKPKDWGEKELKKSFKILIRKGRKAEPIGSISKDGKRKKVGVEKWADVGKSKQKTSTDKWTDKELLESRSFKVKKDNVIFTVAYYPIKEIALTPEKGKKVTIKRSDFLNSLNNGEYKPYTLNLPLKDFTKNDTIKDKKDILQSIEQNRITTFKSEHNKGMILQIKPKFIETKKIYRYNVDYFKSGTNVGSIAAQSQKGFKDAFIELKRLLAQTEDLK